MYPNGMSQPGFSHGPSYSGPPPAKKPKSNPIITRYPPPPGYRPPPPGQASFVPPRPPYGQGFAQPQYAGYPPQPYGATQPYAQPQWPTYQQQPIVPPAHPSGLGYYQTPPASYPAPQPGWPAPINAPTQPPPQAWQPPNTAFNPNKRRHNSTHSATHSAPTRAGSVVSVGPLDGNGDPFPPQTVPTSAADELEDDFDAECYFARHPEDIDPDLSLGMIEWHPPLPTKIVLPSTFQEAELEALAPRKPRPFDEPSISDYFTREKRDESLLSVRQTELWNDVKDDVIFRELPAACRNLVTLADLFNNYRERPDPKWSAASRTASQTPAPQAQQNGIKAESPGDEMHHVGGATQDSALRAQENLDSDDMLGNLEQAIFANGTGHDAMNGMQPTGSGAHSRTTSMSSTAGERITRPKPLAPIRDRAQEDLLAMLGVTGSPKMVYQTPGPAFGAPAPASYEDGRSQRESSVSSQHKLNGGAAEYVKLEEDVDATPRPKMGRQWTGGEYSGMTRKRSYGDLEDEAEDATPRQRAKQSRVDGY